jgi:valyl-tRNA synthetase
MDEYDSEEIESRWRSFWRENNEFKHHSPADYTIDTPPPTVSGSLHLGHVYQYIIQDIPARFQRQKDKSVFFPFGYDNNGIATERFIERQENISRSEVSDQVFSDYYDKVVPSKMSDYQSKMDELGVSVDFGNEYHTIETSVEKRSQLSFIDLYDKGREYREETPAIWCPECETAISQAETDSLEEPSAYHKISFDIPSSNDEVIIETTRPELLPACVSVFIHPNDDRADELVGKTVEVPLFKNEVDILPDERVDQNEGSGIVMCCTFGDTTDIEWYKAHDLDLRIAVNEKGEMTDIAGDYSGLSLEDSRERIVDDLESKGHLLDSRDITHNVQVHNRCDTPTEYRVTSQWYIKLLDKKEEYLEISDEMNWYPEKMKARYRHWVEGLEWDWCVSRQRDVGISIPVWYCNNCEEEVVAMKKQLPVDPQQSDPPVEECDQCGCPDFTPETDVFDTWATSSITPLINSGWNGNNTFENPDRYPMTVRPQGHDIISTWLFYTIVKCYEHTEQVPFRDVLINGHILDENMEKMSASRGNVVEPSTVMSNYSVDAIRYWCAGSSVGSDIPYKEQNLRSAERLLRKLWNASKLVAEMTPNSSETVKPMEVDHIDKWMLSEMETLTEEVSTHYNNYEYSRARRKLRTVFWDTFCDDYLEMAKQRKPNASMRYTLQATHKAFLKMFAPITPYICEEIWNEMYVNMNFADPPADWDDKNMCIHNSGWPEFNSNADDKLQEKGRKAFEIVSDIRNWKSSIGLSLNESVDKITIFEDLSDFETEIQSVTHAEEIKFKEPRDMKVRVNLNYSLVGPEYQDEVNKIERLIENGEFTITDDGELQVGDYSLDNDMFESERVPELVNGENVISGDISAKIEK